MIRASLARRICWMSSLSKVAIIGLGNTLRRDDGIGIHLLAALSERFKDQGIAFLNFGIASFSLLNFFSDFQKVLLIDAIDAGMDPAALRIFRLDEAQFATNEKKLSSHELSLGDILNLYKTLGLSTEVQVAGVQVKDVSYGLEMTPELEGARDRLSDEISRFVSSWGLQ